MANIDDLKAAHDKYLEMAYYRGDSGGFVIIPTQKRPGQNLKVRDAKAHRMYRWLDKRMANILRDLEWEERREYH